MVISEREARDMIEEIMQRGENLNDWESGFIDSVSMVYHNLSYKQLEHIQRIHEQRMKQ